MTSTHVRIDLAPKSGFCIKSTTVTPGVLPAPKSTSNPNLLEPTPGPIPIPKGLKVFVNIAWDPNVPPPPDGSEDAIQRAMQGEDFDDGNPDGWYVPVIVSNGREDKDKSGNPSLVFDCIYNTTVKSRTLRDPEFKIFLVELALQRIEAQTRISLSREISIPNIASKGKLLPRSVQLPASMVPALTGAPSPSNNRVSSAKGIPLIQELNPTAPNPLATKPVPAASKSSPGPIPSSESSSLPGLRGILKTSNPPPVSSTPAYFSSDPEDPLDWSWTKPDDNSSGRLQIDVHVPGLTHSLVKTSSLDIEPRRLTLSIPHLRTLDINLALSDAEIAARIGSAHSSSSSSKPAKQKLDERAARKDAETTRTLQLKRQRDFDVDAADAEWRVGTNTLVIYV